jgi:radical SAM protein with 4Fe4S-binding SPASM domain
MRRVLGEAQRLGGLFVLFTGGEVYSNPHFEAIVSEARRLAFATWVKTSGWNLDDAAARFLAQQAVSEVHVSIHSADPAVHDAVTGTPGSHARAVRAVRALRAHNVRVGLRTTVTSINAASYRSVAALADELGCESSMDASISPCEDGSCGPCQFRASDDVLREFYGDYAWSQLAAAFSPGRPPGSLRPLTETPCLAGDTSLFLASDGMVYPCVDLKLPCGSVLTDSLERIWRESPELRRVRSLTWRDLPACAPCQLRDYCSHCLAIAQNEHGDLLGPAAENCRHALVRRDLLRERGLIPESENALPPPVAPRKMG